MQHVTSLIKVVGALCPAKRVALEEYQTTHIVATARARIDQLVARRLGPTRTTHIFPTEYDSM